MASPVVDHGTSDSRSTQPPDWPAERNPNQWDVHDAQQVPEVSFHRRFKAALLLSADATGCHQYLTESTSSSGAFRSKDFSACGTLRQYTYPMAILEDLPALPGSEVLAQAQASFFTNFGHHVFLRSLAFPSPAITHMTPPYLTIALACLGVTTWRPNTAVGELHHLTSAPLSALASDIFIAGDGLWGVMMEVDNREARLLESVLAGCLFATFGMLSAQEEFQDMSSSTLAGTATMARRTRLHCKKPSPVGEWLFLPHTTDTSSLLMSYLFLTDVTRAIHRGRVPCISTQELFMRMPSSPHNFNQIYGFLISGIEQLPPDLKADEDSLLLLLGICSDILFIQHSFSGLIPIVDPSDQSTSNPYPPLSPSSETLRHHFIFSTALSRWHQHFGLFAGPDVLLMFYFCRMLLAFPDVLKLPKLAGYSSNRRERSVSPSISVAALPRVSDEALDFSWRILENSSIHTVDSGSNVAIWVPVIVFHAGLTVWAHVRQQNSTTKFITGTLRTLKMFKDELDNLVWPCCAEMSETLDHLMRKTSYKAT